MKDMRWRVSVLIMVALPATLALAAEDWVELFDGKSLEGWKASEATNSWSVQDGAIVAHGQPRSHLFYTAAKEPFVNFEFHADVKTTPGSNSGIYFHTKFQPKGWPNQGIEAQVNCTHKDPIKTGSLYGLVKVTRCPHKDNEWFAYDIHVQGKRVVVKVNGETIADWREPANATKGPRGRRIGSGTFALQAHDPGSTVYFRNIKVRRLP